MKLIKAFFIVCFFPAICLAQRITYTEPEREDTKSLEFEVIGKISGNFLVYKNIRFNHAVSVYDNDMSLVERVPLNFVPDKTFNIDFIAYSDMAYLVYQYQKRSIVHCMLAKIDGKGNKIGEPVELDTTAISVFADNKISIIINRKIIQQIFSVIIRHGIPCFMNQIKLLIKK